MPRSTPVPRTTDLGGPFCWVDHGGKLKALSQNLAVLLHRLPVGGVVADLRTPALLVAVAATVLTGLDYARQGARLHASATIRG